MKILSVKMVDGKLEIKAEVKNEFLTETVTWFYTPAQDNHDERIDSDSPMNNTIGYLITGLLTAHNNRLELDDDSMNAIEEMEQGLG